MQGLSAFSGRKRPLIPREGGHPFQAEGGHFFRFVGMGGRNRLEQVVALDRNPVDGQR